MNSPTGGFPRFIEGEGAGLASESTIDEPLFLTHTGAPQFACNIYDTDKPHDTDDPLDDLGEQLELLW
jgi:hypothetical protein